MKDLPATEIPDDLKLIRRSKDAVPIYGSVSRQKRGIAEGSIPQALVISERRQGWTVKMIREHFQKLEKEAVERAEQGNAA
jgi:hypothetical protein